MGVRGSFKGVGLGIAAVAVVGWLRNTATNGSVASVADVLNPANPATSSGTNRPTGALSNGLPVLSFDGSDDFLLHPIIAAINGSPRWGWAGWIRPGTVAGVHTIYASHTLTGASASRLFIQQNGADIFINVHAGAFSVRRGTAAGMLALNTWTFLTVEYDGEQGPEPDVSVITIGGTRQTLAFGNDTGTPNDMPDVLVQPTGNAAIGDLRVSSPLQPWNGLIGTNQFILGGPGVSGGGLLTADQRTVLMNLEAQT